VKGLRYVVVPLHSEEKEQFYKLLAVFVVFDYQLSLSRVCIVIIPQFCSIAKVLCYINLEQSCERWTLCKVPTHHHTGIADW
jgi:hypothetical protein